ncbi:MAG TPA: cytochrome c biogenesis protein CcdA [Syntrophales bacterium]|nr:cytochrome c biogenesis protein CcdA [Syntrophales bacterium]
MDILERLAGQFEFYLGHSSPFAYVAAYLAGLLVSFTPCVYPVVPITAAVIGAQGRVSGGRGFVLSLSFVLGLAVTYTAIGMAAALTGKLFGAAQTSPLTLGLVGALFLLMGLAMLGIVPFSLQRFVPRGLSATGRKGVVGSFVIGLTSGFVLGPCAAPVLIGILGIVAARQSVFFGGSLLFVFSLGVGTLLLLVGTFAGILTSLPRSGTWMVAVQKGSGVVMLAVGAYFLYSAFIS